MLVRSAGTWFQTLSPTQYTTLKVFKDSLKDRFKPNCNSGMAILKQQPGESTELYLERAERETLPHTDLSETYIVRTL